MKILVPTFDFLGWNGGRDLLVHVLRGLCGIEANIELLVTFDPQTVSLVAVEDQLPSDLRSTARFLHCRFDPASILEVARQNDIELALSLFFPLGSDFAIPWIGYIYDFQHRYLPAYFSEAERSQRDSFFSAMLSDAAVVLCNSQSVREDARKFFPEAKPILALPYAPCPQPEWFEYGVESARRKHGLDRPYFMICNQFWVHKDHPTALAAFRRFLDTHPSGAFRLVCTGLNSDYRVPQYASEIADLLRQLDLDSRVLLLGMLPKAEQLALLRGSLGLIQPTRFEGGPGGGSVREAMALGTRILISDIPVNREIPPDLGWLRYFPPGDADRLAVLMADLTTAGDVRPANGDLLRVGRERMRGLSQVLHGAIDRAAGRKL